MTEEIIHGPILGVTHLIVDGHLKPLLKCPFCSFAKVHEETIDHHIRYTDDTKHDIDLISLDKARYIVTYLKSSPYGHYISKEELKLPWIHCPFCKYRDKIGFDLSLHMLEKHKI